MINQMITNNRLFSRGLGFFLWSVIMLVSTIGLPAQAALIRDHEIETELEALAWPLAKEAGLRAIEIRVVSNQSYNAFVMGGLTVYVHTGLLTKAKSPEEILGVLAHEIGHLAAGHAPRRAEAFAQANLTSTLATFAAAAVAASGASGDAALGVALGGMDRANRNYLTTSRYDESVADEWALKILDAQDISASGMADFMRRLTGERALPESRQSDYYRTHPGAGARLMVFEDHIRDHGHDSPGITKDQRAKLARIIGKVKAYSMPPAQTLRDITKSQNEADWPQFDTAINAYRAAIAHYRRGSLEQAEQIMKELVTTDPDDAYFHEFLGDILVSRQKAQQAITAYQAALASGPAPLIEFGLGKAFLADADSGNAASYYQAAQAFQRAIDGERNWAFLYRQLAIALGRGGNLAAADLALANEAVLRGDKQRAKQMANRALSHDDVSDEVRNYANDILFSLQGID